MVDIPAVCSNCGSMFVAPNLIGGAGTVQFVNSRLGPCPYLRWVPEISLMAFTVQQQIQLDCFCLPGTKKSDLLALQQIIKRARKEKFSLEKLEKSVKEEVPELQSLSDWLPKTRMELYAFLGLILTLITIITTSAFAYLDSDDEIPDAEIEKVVERALSEKIAQPKKEVTPRKKNKVGRNDPCPCGSGRKYKKCCLLKK